VALRLYSAGEHTANFVINFLNISKADFKPYKDKYTSMQTAVGNYMKKERPADPITSSIDRLLAEPRWYKTIEYRNTWVHKQPPLMEGLGILYSRSNAIWDGGDRFLGGGDAPAYSLDSLLDMVTAASHAFVNHLSELSDILLNYLKNTLGMKMEKKTADTTTITLPLGPPRGNPEVF
jgi:hypothetical protein